MHESTTIDFTPPSLKHPETAAKVSAAMKEFDTANAEVANEASGFLDTWGTTILRAAPEIKDDLIDLLGSIHARREKQEAFLNALGAVPTNSPRIG